MEIQEIEIVIEEDGQTKIHILGVKGKKCLALTEDLEKALGGEVIKRTMTPEADEPETAVGEVNQVDISQ